MTGVGRVVDRGAALDWRWQSEPIPELPSGPGVARWLTSREREKADAFAIEKRRRDWLLGRLTAKRLLIDVIRQRLGIAVSPVSLDIVRQPSGAPAVEWAGPSGVGPWVAGSRLPLTLSISHSGGTSFCATGWAGADGRCPRIGADVERVEPRSGGLARDFFTDPEAAWCEAAGDAGRNLRTTIVWSAKEAVLKALGVGLSIDTREVTCLPQAATLPDRATVVGVEGTWRPVSVRSRAACDAACPPGGAWWRHEAGFVFALTSL